MHTSQRQKGNDFIDKPVDSEALAVRLKTAERILSLETCDPARLTPARVTESRSAETESRAVPMSTQPPVATAEPAPCKILVVEDDPLLLKNLMELLNATGVPILVATNGEDAIDLLVREHPRIIVSDWMMPKMDGVELCRRIRTLESTDSVHFIMLTVHTDTARLLDAYQAGVNDFVSKPFKQEELLARVGAGIRAAQLRDQLVRKATGSQAINAQLTILNGQLERLALTDELTGLFNRRHAMSRLDEQWALVTRYPRPLTIAMIDLDHFKQINDTHGHEAGDAVLRHIAGILRAGTRSTDIVSRIGGEEFLITFPCQTTEQALLCVERIRAAAESQLCDFRGVAVPATLSVGLAGRAEGMIEAAELVRAADHALYSAKRSGRNRVCTVDDSKAIGANPQAGGEDMSSPLNFATIQKRCGGSAAFATAVTEKFRATAAQEVEKIADALSRADAEALRHAAHTSKSIAAYVAADAAAEFANRIEELGRTNHLGEVAPLLESLRQEVNAVVAWIEQRSAANSLAT